jgi:ribosomal protein S6--L-glutamate ligase
MKLILLASNPNLHSNKRIIEAARQRGHEIEFANIATCYIKIASNDCEIFYGAGKKLEKIDYVIPRIKPAMTLYGAAIVRQLESLKIRCLNCSESITKSRDKLHTSQILSQHGLGVPLTSFANSPYETKNLIKLVGGAPVIVKLLKGTKGVGVVLAETTKSAESVINAFRSLKADILVQHYVKEAKGQDLRCFVIGDEVVASMERLAQGGEFRANIHLGATAQALEITEEEREMAIKAAKIIGLEVAGVDMIRSNNGPKILEVNSSPGLEGIERVTGVDIAAKMIEFVEKKLNK